MSLHCNKCGKDVFAEPQDYYMLKDDVWLALCEKNNLNPYWILCKKCGEKMLGRNFNKHDFQDIEMNYEHGHLKRGKKMDNNYCETPKDNGRTDTLIKAIEELERTKKLYARAKWWLNEIINNHRYTPVSTAEMAVKDLNEKEQIKL